MLSSKGYNNILELPVDLHIHYAWKFLFGLKVLDSDALARVECVISNDKEL